MAPDWIHQSSVVLATFLASLVEGVEALTIVLAVGTTRGWKPALVGSAVGLLLLSLLVALFGPLLSLIPINYLQLFVGLLLLPFGLSWLKKAVLRSAGVIPLRDEAKIYAKSIQAFQGTAPAAPGFLASIGSALTADPIAFLAIFKAVVLEGIEVVFIVITTGTAARAMSPAIFGAAIAVGWVVFLGILLHRPLARVPENTLKFAVGILLTAFGIFWIGEGLGFPWPGEDLAIFALVGMILLISLFMVRVCRPRISA